MLVTLLTLGRLVEMSTLRQSSRAIASLRAALPETAKRVDDSGKVQEVQASIAIRIRGNFGEKRNNRYEPITAAWFLRDLKCPAKSVG